MNATEADTRGDQERATGKPLLSKAKIEAFRDLYGEIMDAAEEAMTRYRAIFREVFGENPPPSVDAAPILFGFAPSSCTETLVNYEARDWDGYHEHVHLFNLPLYLLQDPDWEESLRSEMMRDKRRAEEELSRRSAEAARSFEAKERQELARLLGKYGNPAADDDIAIKNTSPAPE